MHLPNRGILTIQPLQPTNSRPDPIRTRLILPKFPQRHARREQLLQLLQTPILELRQAEPAPDQRQEADRAVDEADLALEAGVGGVEEVGEGEGDDEAAVALVSCIILEVWGDEHGDDVDGCSEADGFVSEARGGGFCLDGVVEGAYRGDVD